MSRDEALRLLREYPAKASGLDRPADDGPWRAETPKDVADTNTGDEGARGSLVATELQRQEKVYRL